jgi:hypothetical protein
MTDRVNDSFLVGNLCKFAVKNTKMLIFANVKLPQVEQNRILWGFYIHKMSRIRAERYFKKDEIALIVEYITEDNSTVTLNKNYDFILFYDNKYWAAQRKDLLIIGVDE